MNIALCTDENYSNYALVVITSLFENNKSHDITVTVLTEGIDPKTELKYKRLADDYNQTINIVNIDAHDVINLKTIKGQFPTSMYFRFYLPDILLGQDRVLYLDCDVIIREDLGAFYGLDMVNFAAGVIQDQNCDDVAIHNRLNITTDYFNSGVMLFNLDYWRNNNIFDQLVNYISSHSDILVYPDQDALNVILAGKVIYADYRYNLQEQWLTNRMNLQFSKHRFEDLAKSCARPAIVHFCTMDKPWYKECRNPYLNEFLHYANIHSYIKIKRRSRIKYIDKLYYSLRRRLN